MLPASRSYRPCPLCGNFESQRICSIHLSPVADESLPPSFHVVFCTRCGFCFDDLMACQDDFDRYYARSIKYQQPDTWGSGDLSVASCARYAAVFDVCKKYLQDDFFLLDIGAGKGGLLRYIARVRERLALYAVEPSIYSMKSHDGIKFFGNLDELINEHVKFDMIFCTHVMEHVYDLHFFIKMVKSVIKEKGMLYIEVPNASAYIDGHNAPFYYFDREHINHFTPVSMKRLFSAHGFDVVWSNNSHNISVLFRKSEKENAVELLNCDTYVQRILAYVEKSKKIESMISYTSITYPVVLWGFGAYLRRVFLKTDFPKPIAAIIDRDRGGQGQMWNGIPLVTADILAKKEFSRATVLITSVLYAEEIQKEIAAMNFQGAVVTAF